MRDVLFGLGFVVLGIWVCWYAGTFPEARAGMPGPSLFPRLIAVGLVVGGGALILTHLIRRGAVSQGKSRMVHEGAEEDIATDLSSNLKLLIVVGVTAATPMLGRAFGLIPAIALLSFVTSILLKANPVVAFVVSVLGAFAIYWVFSEVLGVPL